MNNWHNERMAEYNRQKILETAEQIQLEKLAGQARRDHPGRFQRMMFNFANWMIHTGNRLRKRYEIPAAHCTHTGSKRFAH